MFLKNCELVIIATSVFYNIITCISSYQDSIYYLDDNYDNKLPALRRYGRHTEFNLCLIPAYPIHTNYKIFDQFNGRYKTGDYAPNLATLEVTCAKGFKPNPLAQNVSICIGGIWTPKPTNCMRACPSLKSTISTNVKCSHNNAPLDNCYDPVEETTVFVSCNPLFEDSTADIYPDHLCLNGEWEPSIPQCKPMCGQKRPLGSLNIVNGRDSIRGNYPWHIGIYYASNHGYLCGGSIITPKIVLSAAHCFTDSNNNILSPESYLVAAGKFYRRYNHNSDAYAQYSKIYKINIPELYKGNGNFEALDIAVLVLENRFSITRAVQPVCIELNEEVKHLHLHSNSIGIVTGWGYTQEGAKLADVLKEVDIPFIPHQKCYDEIPINFRQYFTSDKICGGYKNSATSVCTGDSGGGLCFNNMITGRFYIKGVVSTSPATITNNCDSNQYNLYTSIAAHVQFIRDIVIHNQLYDHVECKYDRCVSEKPRETAVIDSLIKNIYNSEEIVKNSDEYLLLKDLNQTGHDNDVCGKIPRCSCIYFLFNTTSESKRDTKEPIKKTINELSAEGLGGIFRNSNTDKSCEVVAQCFPYYSVLYPAHRKGDIRIIKEKIQRVSAANLINVEIYEDYDKCTPVTWFTQLFAKSHGNSTNFITKGSAEENFKYRDR